MKTGAVNSTKAAVAMIASGRRARRPVIRTKPRPIPTARMAPRPWARKKASCQPSTVRSTGRNRYSWSKPFVRNTANTPRAGRREADGLEDMPLQPAVHTHVVPAPEVEYQRARIG